MVATLQAPGPQMNLKNVHVLLMFYSFALSHYKRIRTQKVNWTYKYFMY